MADRFGAVIAAGLVSFGLSLAPLAMAQTSDGLPKLGFSIAEKGVGVVGGPLFDKLKAVFAAAKTDDGAAFASALAPNASVKLTGDSGEVPFTVETVKAITQACLGPYAYDENKTWVQMSWICPDDVPSLLPFRFHRSPELTLLAWFDGGAIRKIEASEPLPWPGAKRVARGAYEALKARADQHPN